MTSKIIAISVILTCIFSCEKTCNENKTCPGQFIVADSDNECVITIDIDPDSVVSAYGDENGILKVLKSNLEAYVDMSLTSESGFWDKIGNLDFKFKIYFSSAGAGSIIEEGICLITYDNEYLEYSTNSDINVLKIYDLGDTINDLEQWKTFDEVTLSKSLISLCPPNCPGEQDSINTKIQDKFIGLREANPLDTLYF
jgi:hypothetical protein